MKKNNCWEFIKCGREYGGKQVRELGVCPVSIESRLDGTHGGTNGGRACWIVPNSLCNGTVQGTFVVKFRECMKCGFYRSVKYEEAENFQMAVKLFDRLDK